MQLSNNYKTDSKLRIIIPAFPEFNVYSNFADKMTALGPLCVATLANSLPDWKVEVIDENNYRDSSLKNEKGYINHKALQEKNPADIVGFYGGLTSTVPRIYELAEVYKKMDVTTIAGGQHFVDENIEEALQNSIDFVFIGEAEISIQKFLQKFKEGSSSLHNIKGLVYKENEKTVINEPSDPITYFERLPVPDYSLVKNSRIKIFSLERIRGCGMNCEFCTVKGKPRASSPERFMKQVRNLVENYNADTFFIVDDLFSQHRTETLEVCRMLADYQKKIRKKLKFTVQIRLDKARDKELLTAMRNANIRNLAIGFESPIEEEIESMNKNLRTEEMLQLTKKYHDFGFLIHGMFIFGYPLKNPSKFKLTSQQRAKKYKEFIKKAKIDTIQIVLPVPLPGTALRKRLKKQNRIFPIKDVGWEFYDGNFPLFEPDPPMTAERLHEGAMFILTDFYSLKNSGFAFLNLINFPKVLLKVNSSKTDLQKWYFKWRNCNFRLGGWFIIKKWLIDFKKNKFLEKLKKAKFHIQH